MRPPCEGKREFTNPSHATPEQIADAIEMCHHCPIRVPCAKQALHAGDTIDGERKAPARDVIQAGVWLTGRREYLNEVYKLAGKKPAPPKRRAPTPTHCRACKKRMVPRDKTVSLGAHIVTHVARGYCRVCYARLKREGKLTTLHPKHQAALGWREKHQRKTS